MSNKVQIKIPPASPTLSNLWLCDTLLAKAGDRLCWEGSEQEMILFLPSAGLFEDPQAPAEQRIFNIDAQSGYRIELKLKAGDGRSEETIMIPYAIFRIPAGESSDSEMRAKMIIKRSGG